MTLNDLLESFQLVCTTYHAFHCFGSLKLRVLLPVNIPPENAVFSRRFCPTASCWWHGMPDFIFSLLRCRWPKHKLQFHRMSLSSVISAWLTWQKCWMTQSVARSLCCGSESWYISLPLHCTHAHTHNFNGHFWVNLRCPVAPWFSEDLSYKDWHCYVTGNVVAIIILLTINGRVRLRCCTPANYSELLTKTCVVQRTDIFTPSCVHCDVGWGGGMAT